MASEDIRMMASELEEGEIPEDGLDYTEGISIDNSKPIISQRCFQNELDYATYSPKYSADHASCHSALLFQQIRSHHDISSYKPSEKSYCTRQNRKRPISDISRYHYKKSYPGPPIKPLAQSSKALRSWYRNIKCNHPRIKRDTVKPQSSKQRSRSNSTISCISDCSSSNGSNLKEHPKIKSEDQIGKIESKKEKWLQQKFRLTTKNKTDNIRPYNKRSKMVSDMDIRHFSNECIQFFLKQRAKTLRQLGDTKPEVSSRLEPLNETRQRTSPDNDSEMKDTNVKDVIDQAKAIPGSIGEMLLEKQLKGKLKGDPNKIIQGFSDLQESKEEQEQVMVNLGNEYEEDELTLRYRALQSAMRGLNTSSGEVCTVEKKDEDSLLMVAERSKCLVNENNENSTNNKLPNDNKSIALSYHSSKLSQTISNENSAVDMEISDDNSLAEMPQQINPHPCSSPSGPSTNFSEQGNYCLSTLVGQTSLTNQNQSHLLPTQWTCMIHTLPEHSKLSTTTFYQSTDSLAFQQAANDGEHLSNTLSYANQTSTDFGIAFKEIESDGTHCGSFISTVVQENKEHLNGPRKLVKNMNNTFRTLTVVPIQKDTCDLSVASSSQTKKRRRRRSKRLSKSSSCESNAKVGSNSTPEKKSSVHEEEDEDLLRALLLESMSFKDRLDDQEVPKNNSGTSTTKSLKFTNDINLKTANKAVIGSGKPVDFKPTSKSVSNRLLSPRQVKLRKSERKMESSQLWKGRSKVDLGGRYFGTKYPFAEAKMVNKSEFPYVPIPQIKPVIIPLVDSSDDEAENFDEKSAEPKIPAKKAEIPECKSDYDNNNSSADIRSSIDYFIKSIRLNKEEKSPADPPLTTPKGMKFLTATQQVEYRKLKELLSNKREQLHLRKKANTEPSHKEDKFHGESSIKNRNEKFSISGVQQIVESQHKDIFNDVPVISEFVPDVVECLAEKDTVVIDRTAKESPVTVRSSEKLENFFNIVTDCEKLSTLAPEYSVLNRSTSSDSDNDSSSLSSSSEDTTTDDEHDSLDTYEALLREKLLSNRQNFSQTSSIHVDEFDSKILEEIEKFISSDCPAVGDGQISKSPASEDDSKLADDKTIYKIDSLMETKADSRVTYNETVSNCENNTIKMELAVSSKVEDIATSSVCEDQEKRAVKMKIDAVKSAAVKESSEISDGDKDVGLGCTSATDSFSSYTIQKARILKNIKEEYDKKYDSKNILMKHMSNLLEKSSQEVSIRQTILNKISKLYSVLDKLHLEEKKRASNVERNIESILKLQQKVDEYNKKLLALQTYWKTVSDCKSFSEEQQRLNQRKFELQRAQLMAQINFFEHSMKEKRVNPKESKAFRVDVTKSPTTGTNTARKTHSAISPTTKEGTRNRVMRDEDDILCPFDLLGRCNDDLCPYLHLDKPSESEGSAHLKVENVEPIENAHRIFLDKVSLASFSSPDTRTSELIDPLTASGCPNSKSLDIRILPNMDATSHSEEAILLPSTNDVANYATNSQDLSVPEIVPISDRSKLNISTCELPIDHIFGSEYVLLRRIDSCLPSLTTQSQSPQLEVDVTLICSKDKHSPKGIDSTGSVTSVSQHSSWTSGEKEEKSSCSHPLVNKRKPRNCCSNDTRKGDECSTEVMKVSNSDRNSSLEAISDDVGNDNNLMISKDQSPMKRKDVIERRITRANKRGLETLSDNMKKRLRRNEKGSGDQRSLPGDLKKKEASSVALRMRKKLKS